jgi:hypothetical protein
VHWTAASTRTTVQREVVSMRGSRLLVDASKPSLMAQEHVSASAFVMVGVAIAAAQ